MYSEPTSWHGRPADIVLPPRAIRFRELYFRWRDQPMQLTTGSSDKHYALRCTSLQVVVAFGILSPLRDEAGRKSQDRIGAFNAVNNINPGTAVVLQSTNQ